jgi:hypothetical protein
MKVVLFQRGHVILCDMLGYSTRRISSLCQECSDYLLFFASKITLYNYTTSTIFNGGQAKTLVFGFRWTLGFITKGFVDPLRSHLLPRYDFTCSAIRCSGNAPYKLMVTCFVWAVVTQRTFGYNRFWGNAFVVPGNTYATVYCYNVTMEAPTPDTLQLYTICL